MARDGVRDDSAYESENVVDLGIATSRENVTRVTGVRNATPRLCKLCFRSFVLAFSGI